ncbi:MAG: stage II sporulation protein R [Clostridiales bacterium]|nr:stage II sporulation protein R [Clostridiales bacterium]
MNYILKLKLKLKHLHNRLLHSEPNKNRISILFLLTLLIISWMLTQAVKIHAANPGKIQEGIAREIIRFHVIANSDSDEDQELKIQVKDALVDYLKPSLKNTKDIEDAQSIISEMLPSIQSMATHIIEENGYKYNVTASLSSSYFPMKVYGNYTFPPGQYEALQVRIGNSEGRNWWCLMFPPLCFVDETYNIVDEDGEEKLEYLLTEEELDALKNEKVPMKIRLKIFDYIKKLFN